MTRPATSPASAAFQALGFDTAEEVAGPRALQRMECGLTDAWRAAGVLDAQRADLKKRYGQGRTAAAWTIRPSVLPQALYPDIWIADRGLELLNSMPSNQPWLLWISFTGPHEPFDTPAPWHGRHHDSALPSPTPKPSWIDSLPQHAELKRCADGWRELLTPEQIQACRADYADHLKLLDDQLQKILEKLNQRSDADNTAVALTSDHGDMLGDAGMLYKGTFLESAIRVPFIYRAPKRTGHNPQKLSNQALALTDLLGQILRGLPREGTATNPSLGSPSTKPSQSLPTKAVRQGNANFVWMLRVPQSGPPILQGSSADQRLAHRWCADPRWERLCAGHSANTPIAHNRVALAQACQSVASAGIRGGDRPLRPRTEPLNVVVEISLQKRLFVRWNPAMKNMHGQTLPSRRASWWKLASAGNTARRSPRRCINLHTTERSDD